MDIYNDDVIRSNGGLQEMYTDFDSWICKFSRHYYLRPINSVSLSKIDEKSKLKITNNSTQANAMKLENLIVQGFLLGKLTLNTDDNTFCKKYYLFYKMLRKNEDLCVEAPWGKISCISWGDPKNPPVLMVHGYMDSAATFIPILKHLPDSFYYVAVDLPGHGKSNALPVGPLTTHGHQVEAVKQVVDYLKWNKFIYFTHSVGFFIGVFFNYIYPFRISKMVNLDPVPPLSTYCFQEYSPFLWYQYMYDDYYDNYSRFEQHRTKQYTYEQAINLLVKSRKLTKEQSAIVLSRLLVPLGDGMYRLSWESTMKKVIGIPMTEETLSTIILTNAPPMLNVVASEDETISVFKKNGIKLMNRFKKSLPNFEVINVTGTHDVHITNPELFVDKIIDFMNCDFVKAKL